MRKPALVVFAGLPGVGKTTLAKETARELGAVYVRVDSIERALAESTLKIHPAEDAGYVIGYALAEDNLRLGASVVADSVNPLELTRTAWLEPARKAGCHWVEVEVVCSDPVEHKRRVEERLATEPSGRCPDWQRVLDREYHPFERERLVIDTAGKSVEQCVAELRSLLASALAPKLEEHRN